MKWDAEKYDAIKAPQVDAGRELIALADVKAADSILDIGCGTGKLTIELARLAPQGTVIGIDPSPEMLAKAREASTGIANVNLMQILAQDINFDERFTLAFSNSTLQWVKDQEKTLSLIYRSLKPGGRIAFQMPAKNFCGEFFDYTAHAVHELRLEGHYVNWQTPWRFSTREEYGALVRDAGFVNVNVFIKDYRLVFDGIQAVLAWWASAGLRPYLAPLSESEQERFKAAFAKSFEKNRTEKGVEFGFKRLFAFAEKMKS